MYVATCPDGVWAAEARAGTPPECLRRKWLVHKLTCPRETLRAIES